MDEIGEIEDALYECDLRGDSAGARLPLIQDVIDALVAASADTAADDHQCAGVRVAKLEMKGGCEKAIHKWTISF